MNLRDIDVFHAIMISGGAGTAAALLDTSQPAISRSLAKLEAELGFSLFDRIRGRLVPTREALLFHAEVKANLVGLDRLKLRAAQIKEVGAGTIRVASLSALGHGLVPRAITAFSRKHPQVRISYQVRTSNVVRDLVASGSFDIGLAADEIDTNGVLHSVFTTPRAVCVMPQGHPLASRDVITPADLNDEGFLALAPEDTVRLAMDRIFAEHGVQPRILVETPYGVTIAILAAQGLGIGLVNPFIIADKMIQGIVIRPFAPAVHFRALLLKPPGSANSRLVSAFVAELYAIRNSLAVGDEGSGQRLIALGANPHQVAPSGHVGKKRGSDSWSAPLKSLFCRLRTSSASTKRNTSVSQNYFCEKTHNYENSLTAIP